MGIDPKIKLALWEAADDSLGIYPAAVNGVPRTDWQDGWNKALISLSERREKFVAWFKGLPERRRQLIGELLADEDSGFSLLVDQNDEVWLVYNTSDLFAWGYSSCDVVESDTQLEQLYQAWQAKGHLGVLVWQCKHENEKPQTPMEERMREAGVWDEEMNALPDNQYDAKSDH